MNCYKSTDMNILLLPGEILSHISTFLDIVSIINLRLVCQDFYNVYYNKDIRDKLLQLRNKSIYSISLYSDISLIKEILTRDHRSDLLFYSLQRDIDIEVPNFTILNLLKTYGNSDRRLVRKYFARRVRRDKYDIEEIIETDSLEIYKLSIDHRNGYIIDLCISSDSVRIFEFVIKENTFKNYKSYYRRAVSFNAFKIMKFLKTIIVL